MSTKFIDRGEFNINVIFEDDQVIVINKPAGISMHAKNIEDRSKTIYSILKSELADNDKLRGGIVHRLDKDTSGVLIMAKTTNELMYLQQQFANRLVDKSYIALVWGHLKHPRARIELPIKRSTKAPNKMSIDALGKMAISEYRVLAEYDKYSLVQINIHTGRTHQIRVQFAHMGHPIVGDRLYASKPMPEGLSRQFLHAKSLALNIERGKLKQKFEADMPKDLTDFLESLDG
jgi:23S rRNA pseudouridine1911/1915/1917 synthase